MQRLQEQMVFELFDSVPVPAMVIGADETILAATPKAKEIFDFDLRNRHYMTILRSPDLVGAIESVLKSGENKTAQYSTYSGGRSEFYDVICSHIDRKHIKGVLVVFQNTSQANQIEQIRRDFVANVSHELRTPLTAMLGFIDTLQGPAKEDQTAQERFLDLMKAEATRMNNLVNDLLSLSRVEANEQVRPTDIIDLRSIVETLAARFENAAQEAEVSLVFNTPEEPVNIRADREQILQLFSNLMENAIKYGSDGNRVEMTITYDPNHALLRGPAAIVKVEDFGAGIQQEHLPRLSERFYRVDTHRSRELGGTGLGLAIVKHILNRHRGRMKVESTLGKGTQFYVKLPAEPV